MCFYKVRNNLLYLAVVLRSNVKVNFFYVLDTKGVSNITKLSIVPQNPNIARQISENNQMSITALSISSKYGVVK